MLKLDDTEFRNPFDKRRIRVRKGDVKDQKKEAPPAEAKDEV